MPRNNIKQFRDADGVAAPPHFLDTSLEAAWKREHARAETAVEMMHYYRRQAEHWKTVAEKAKS